MSEPYSEDEHVEFMNTLVERTGDEWDDDTDMESIVIRYVRHLEDEVQRLGGCRRPNCWWDDGDNCDHGYLRVDVAPDGVGMIATERRRQVEVEGWTPDHDDEHDACEMAMAAASYIWHTVGQVNGVCWPVEEFEEERPDLPPAWPWHPDWWKPGDPVRNLAKAGALIAAEIDRLQRRSTDGVG